MLVVVPAIPRLARRGLNDNARFAGFRSFYLKCRTDGPEQSGVAERL